MGGETAFANQILAYGLSVGIKRLLDDLIAEHSAEDLAPPLRGGCPGGLSGRAPGGTCVHEDSGERALYVCGPFTRRFKDWTRAESKMLLEFLVGTVCVQNFRPGTSGGQTTWLCGITGAYCYAWCMITVTIRDYCIVCRCRGIGPMSSLSSFRNWSS